LDKTFHILLEMLSEYDLKDLQLGSRSILYINMLCYWLFWLGIFVVFLRRVL